MQLTPFPKSSGCFLCTLTLSTEGLQTLQSYAGCARGSLPAFQLPKKKKKLLGLSQRLFPTTRC